MENVVPCSAIKKRGDNKIKMSSLIAAGGNQDFYEFWDGGHTLEAE